jgi:Reverse transcriptase (RNA-dependent DNA polymerase)
MLVNARSVKNKIDELRTLAGIYDPGVIVVVETWLSDEIVPGELALSGYSMHRRDRNKHGGGVLIACKKQLNASTVWVDDAFELMCVKTKGIGGLTYIIGGYRTGPGGAEFMDRVEERVGSLGLNKRVLIAGDLNFPDASWKPSSVGTGAVQTHINRVLSMGFEQAVSKGTRQKADGENNLLDIVLVRPMDIIIRSEVLEGISDHKTVLVEIEEEDSCRTRQVEGKKEIWCYEKANTCGLKQELWDNFESWALSQASVEQRWSELMAIFTNARRRHIPVKISKANGDPPYYDNKVKRLKRKARGIYNKRTSARERTKKLKEKKIQIKAAIKVARDEYFLGMLENGEREGWKKLFGHIRRTRNGGNAIPVLVDEEGVEYVEAKEKADALNKYYSEVFSDLVAYPEKIPLKLRGPEPIVINLEAVMSAVQSLKRGKSPGIDGLTASFLKIAGFEAACYLDSLFNQIIREGVIPSVWKKALVIPIFKGGEKRILGNYRPISLTSTACKVLEKIIDKYIRVVLHKNDSLSQAQHGFRSKHSCETQLVALVQEMAEVLDRGGELDAAFLDMKKAFDKVPHSRLIQKVGALIEDKAVVNIINEFLSNREQRVRLDGETSDEVKVTSGVPQGSVLGPLLFIIYINDIVTNVKSRIRLFADDCVIYREVSDETDEEILQEDLARIGEWMHENNMQLNLSKCEIVAFSKKKEPKAKTYKLEGQELGRKNGAKYLGVWLDEKLEWKSQVAKVAEKGIRSLNFIMRNLQGTGSKVKEKAYTALVRPIVEYGGIVWDPYRQGEIQEVERVQRLAARRVTGRTGRFRWENEARVLESPTEMIQELGWESLENRRARARLCAMHRVICEQEGWKELGNRMVECAREGRRGPKYRERGAQTDAGKYSFANRTIRQWNSLKPEVRTKAKELSTKVFRSQYCSSNLFL